MSRPGFPEQLQRLLVALSRAEPVDPVLARQAARSALEAGSLAALGDILAASLPRLGEDGPLLRLCAIGAAREGKVGVARQLWVRAANTRMGDGAWVTEAALALVGLGGAVDAVRLVRTALEREPERADLWIALARTLDAAGQGEPAIAAGKRAVHLAPGDPAALAQLALVLQRTERKAEAAELYARVLALVPDHLAALRNLAVLEAGRKRMEQAVALRRRAAEARPDLAEVQFEYAHTLDRAGHQAEAKAILQRLPSGDALSFGWSWAGAQMLPLVWPNEPAMEQGIAAWQREIQEKSVAALRLPDRAALFGKLEPCFTGHYAGGSCLKVQSTVGDLCARVAQLREPAWARAPEPLAAAHPRIGFVSAFFRGHTVGRLFSAWAAGLAARGVEVHVWHTGSGRDAESEELSANVHRFYHLSGRAEGLVTAVRAARLHGVIFPELGMDLATFHAASTKLAPIQAMAWGHPVSSGLPTMDLFLSSRVMEPDQGADHYRETLVPLPGLSIQYRRPPRVVPRPRSELGVPEGVPMLVCVQSLFKILPRHDAMFAGLLARSPRAHLVMLAHSAEPVTRAFRERLSACLSAHGVDPAGRLHFLPQMNREHFLGLLAAADLYIDGPGWSGGNTTLEAVSQGCVILCRWGQTMRERHTAGILQQMGLSDQIATDEEDWIARGVRWAEDPDARAASSAAVRAGADGLFADSRPLDALADLVHGWQKGTVGS